jgi:ABC-type antimicrobial peptide transport system permease subunit
VAAAVRKLVRELDPDVPIDMTTLESLIAGSVSDRRFTLLLLGAFAAIALLLAATGIYSVLTQIVAQRTQEIGIRMALGADAPTVVRLMLGNALVPVVAGIVAGAIGSAFGVRLLASFLFGVQPLDPLAFAAAAGLLAVVAVVAGYLPARRATRVDPLIALRAR